MCVMDVSLGSKVSRTLGCIAMGSAVLFILRSRLSAYSEGYGVNSVQVVLYGFSVRLCLSRQALDVGMIVCISWLYSCLCVWML